MAKYEWEGTGSFDALLEWVDEGILGSSFSATYEDGSDLELEDVRIAIRVYERYSMIGSNRVSLNVTILGKGDRLFLSAIPSGGSQAMLIKINRWGEEAFLERLAELVDQFPSNR